MKQKRQSSFISPMLATLTEKYFSDPAWIFEDKFDGIRAIIVKKNGKVNIYSRNRNKLNKRFSKIVEELEKLKTKDYIADSEIVAFDGKVTSFSKLQRIKQEKTPVFIYIFDLLYFDRFDLRDEPVINRKKLLKKHLKFSRKIRYTPHRKKEGERLLKQACRTHKEGVIAKKADSKYVSKRTRNWLKFKCLKGQEFVIVGYTNPQRSRIGFGALLIGYYEKGKLKYAGGVGTGFDDKFLSSFSKRLEKLKIKKKHFSSKEIKEKNPIFVSPRFVCEIAFSEWTRDGKLRHPRFIGLRFDKKAKSVVRERGKK